MEGAKSKARLGGVFHLTARDKDGNIKWEDVAPNIVTNVGLQHILDVVFSGGSASGTWYIGLADDDPSFAAGDTLGSHGGGTEFDEYSDNRKEWVEVRSDQEMTNSASKASFSITAAGGGVGGAFLCDAATGTTDTLMSGAALSGGNRTVAADDTVEVTYTFSAADDGS